MKVTEMKLRKENGLTLIGFLIALCVVLFFAYAGMRIVPMYLEYHALGNALSKNSLWASYASNNIKNEHIRISKKSGGVNVRVAYEVRKPFLGNIDIIGSFDKAVTLQ